MTGQPAARILVAGVGNIFQADDGFGVEVAHRLAARALPDQVIVADYGIRSLYLAYDIAGGGYERVVLIDTLARGAPPGTVELFEPSADDAAAAGVPDAHGSHPGAVIQLVRMLGAAMPPTIVVGCEPASMEPGVGLTPAVQDAVEPAVEAVLAVVQNVQHGGASDVSGDSRSDTRDRDGRAAPRRRRSVKGAAKDQHRSARK